MPMPPSNGSSDCAVSFALQTFLTHLNTAHLQESPVLQDHDILNIDSLSPIQRGNRAKYGAQVTGNNLQRADLNQGQRSGFLTQAAFLSLTGAADGSHPVRRGKAVYQKLLCRDLPPPPANVQPAKPASQCLPSGEVRLLL